MSLDQASYGELWRLTDMTNGDLRPEYVLAFMGYESGLQPGAQNGGCYGLNQLCSAKPGGVDPQTYLSWPASKQIRHGVAPYLKWLNDTYGPLRSGVRLYQGNWIPESLKLAHNFPDVIAARGGTRYKGQEGVFYDDNRTLDTNHDGQVTVGDIDAVINAQLRKPSVDAAIAAAYVFRGEPRPGVGASIDGPRNPALGTDFDAHGNYIGGGAISPTKPGTAGSSAGFPWFPVLLGVGMVGAAGAAFWYLENKGPRRYRLLENPVSSEIQSLLFRRDAGWTVTRAKAWARSHGYKTSKVDVTDDHIRLRQHPPGGRMRTKQFGRGISAVVRFG
jgi:hypothetical protein